MAKYTRYIGNDLSTVEFIYHGEKRVVDLAEEASININDLDTEFLQNAEKRSHWFGVLAWAEEEKDKADDESKLVLSNISIAIRDEEIEATGKKPSDKSVEDQAKRYQEYQDALDRARKKKRLYRAIKGLTEALDSREYTLAHFADLARRDMNVIISSDVDIGVKADKVSKKLQTKSSGKRKTKGGRQDAQRQNQN